MASKAFQNRAVPIALCALITLWSAIVAFYTAFSNLAFYDDEGAMMNTVLRFVEGRPLYDAIVTVYGPVYYFYEWFAHALTGAAVTHDSVRFVSITLWVAAGVMAFLLVWRATGSVAIAAVIQIVAVQTMRFIGREPAHPQEVCILLLLVFGRACYAENRTLRMALLGALVAAMAATKINLGIFVVIALAIAFSFAVRQGWLRTAASVTVSVAALLFPIVLMRGHMKEEWAMRFCALVVVSTAAVILTVSRVKWETHIRARDLLVCGLAFAGTLATVCSFPLLHGSTLRGMIQALIVKPSSFGSLWFLPVSVESAALLWAVAGLICAWHVRQRLGSPAFTAGVIEGAIASAKLVFAAAVVSCATFGHYPDVLEFAPSWLWLVVISPGPMETASPNAARSLLALTATLQILYAYPVGGSQVPFAVVFILVVSGICLWDGISWLRTTFPAWDRRSRSPVIHKALSFAAGIALTAACCVWLSRAYRKYESFEPLKLPGSSLIRLEPERATVLRDLTAKVHSLSCSTLVTEPGMFSFNMWTGRPAPSTLLEVWMALLSGEEEEHIVREIAPDLHTCVITLPVAVRIWTRGADISSQPLVRYIDENFWTIFEGQGYFLKVRKSLNP